MAQDVIEVSNLDLLIEMSKISLGVGSVIRDFVQNELKAGSLLEIPLGTPLQKREIGFAYNLDGKISKPLKQFLAFYEAYKGGH